MPWEAIATGLGTAAAGIGSGLFGGGSPDVSFEASGQQEMLFDRLYPIVKKLKRMSTHPIYGMDPTFTPPQMGQAPQMTGPPWMGRLPSMYGIPSIQNMLPTSSWWNNLSPEIKEGLYAPYEESADMLQERLGALGQLGSARPGGSAAAGEAMGRLYSDASRDVPLTAFNLTQPARRAQFDAELGRNIADYQARMNRYGTEYNLQLEPWRQNYLTSLEPWRQNYAGQMMGWQMPYNIGQNLAGMIPATFPGGIATQPQNPFASILGGLGQGTLAYSMMNQNTGGKGGAGGQAGYPIATSMYGSPDTRFTGFQGYGL